MKKFRKKFLFTISGLALIYLVLLIPDQNERNDNRVAVKKTFAWNRNDQWLQLEALFREAKAMRKDSLDAIINMHKIIAEDALVIIKNKNIEASDAVWIKARDNFFVLASLIAVRQDQIPWLTDYYNRFRILVKLQSQQWDLSAISARNTIYSLLYGLRAAWEEVLLQVKNLDFPASLQVKNEQSVTPAAAIFGIEVHSGDLLVSRGGAEVSALISRGNDFAGNFSHIALIYVNEKTKVPFLIEAHIEKGVAIASVDEYENDKKLRFMVMRPRADLPVMIANPMLPHLAAKAMLSLAGKRHIPYDFKMDFNDTTAMFCSEVASYAYLKKGIQIWKYPSTISSQGVVNWLGDFGVENFVTQMPSDLEYDPQLVVVAEWRDPETLSKDHIDNAVMDALLEKADKGEAIGYTIWKLPLVRILKGYCIIKNIFGKTGLIPEGMSATRALKNQHFVAMYARVKSSTLKLTGDFIARNGYRPPYWQLIKMAEMAANTSAGN
jgi:hypothetical protein